MLPSLPSLDHQENEDHRELRPLAEQQLTSVSISQRDTALHRSTPSLPPIFTPTEDPALPTRPPRKIARKSAIPVPHLAPATVPAVAETEPDYLSRQSSQDPLRRYRHFSFTATPFQHPANRRNTRPASLQHSPSLDNGDNSLHARYTLSESSTSTRKTLATTLAAAGAEQAAAHVGKSRTGRIEGPQYRSGSETTARPQTPPPMSSNSRPKPSMTLEFNGTQRSISNEYLNPDIADKPPKSPGVIGAFFGWKTASPQKTGTESPTTTFSEPSLSPALSPAQLKPNKPLPTLPSGQQARLAPAGLDIPRANANYSRAMNSLDTPMHMHATDMSAHVQELERELAQVSAELAGSIRREMDLEDEVERLSHSMPPSELSRRGSDYFSDSGAASVRYPISDPDAKILEEERLRRKAEQDRAQTKLDMAAKTQTELSKRRELEELVQRLEDQLDRQSNDGSEKKEKRVEELEAQLEENKRRLKEEKEARANFEDLYTALQSELSSGRRHLGSSRGFGSIAEESGNYSSGLSRSGSLARSGSKRAGSVTRSGSVKGRARSGSASTPVTAEGLQEVEDQRDALHKALKLLINRFDKQQKEHERHIKKLTRQKRVADKLTVSPDKSTYHREVSVLKEEVTTLRKRTEDALEQKWQYEKSLGGIKMDLDRAEQETRGLRDLLKEHDILAPSPLIMQSATFASNDATTKQILSAAEEEREQARKLAEQFRSQAVSMQKSGADPAAISEMQQAAARMDKLYQQFDHQIKRNTALHHRLSAAVEKGEREQEQSTRQIQDMQKKLAGMEDSLLAAQQHSENTLNKHESQVRSIEESTSPRLHRFTLEVTEAAKSAPVSPGAMRRSTLGGIKKKVLDQSLLDASRTSMLERKVRELERLLRDAEDDMQQVVQRVNKSQIEVAELTNERDAAFTQMRKLQDRLVTETEHAESLMDGRKPRPGRGYDSGSDYGD